MSTMEFVRPRLARFVQRMEAKLAIPDNLSKQNWTELHTEELEDLLLGEVRELITALEALRRGDMDITIQDIIDECADVANFAMMIADNLTPNGPTGSAS